MKLLTEELKTRFAEVGRQDTATDPLVIAKFFNPAGQGTWLATEYEPETKIFFGYVALFNTPQENELGTFSLDELESVKLPFGLGIERDIHFKEKELSKAKSENGIY